MTSLINRLKDIRDWHQRMHDLHGAKQPAQKDAVEALDQALDYIAEIEAEDDAVLDTIAEYAKLKEQVAQQNLNLADVLCCVSQIFNGWRGCEEWSKFDEETAQRVVAIQRQVDENRPGLLNQDCVIHLPRPDCQIGHAHLIDACGAFEPQAAVRHSGEPTR